MNTEELQGLLCARYCSYYKPGKTEELACKGYSVIERLFAAQKKIPVRIDKVVLKTTAEDDLFRILCRTCPFYEQDCDFAAWRRGNRGNDAGEAVNPCGGFLCLGDCIDTGIVDIRDLYRVI